MALEASGFPSRGPTKVDRMYQNHWGLSDDPFRNGSDPRRFFRTSGGDEGLARLHFLVEGSWRLGMVLGPAGIGKSLLLNVFGAELSRAPAQFTKIPLRGLGSDDFLWQLASGLFLQPGPGDSSVSLWQQVADRLVENRYQRIRTVVALDDLDQAAGDVRLQVERLLQYGNCTDATLSVIATTSPVGLNRLGRLAQLIDLRVDLEPWTVKETDEYLRHALRQAGCPRPIFQASAVERLHRLSRGIPRRINRLAEMAMLAAAVGQLRQIDAETVEGVEQELASPLAVGAEA
jgi:type II secretory pathway predicted ATPase ExeA